VKKLALVLFLSLVGCTGAQAKADLQKTGAAALGLLTLAENNPTLVNDAKTGISDLAAQVDPKDAPTINAVLSHVNAGNIALAKAKLAPYVASLSPSAAPVASASK
jgi:hypothetical protein